MDDKVRKTSRSQVYQPKEIEPQGQKRADRSLDTWIARNKAELNKSLREGRKALRQGKGLLITSRERLVADIVSKGRKRRAKRVKKADA